MFPIQPTPVAAKGNAEVVAMFEQWLERAKQGQIAFAGVVACEHPIHVVTDHRGSMQLAFAANWGLDTLKLLLQERAAGRHEMPDVASYKGNANRVCYDVSTGPACYDFIAWLIIAEMNRIRSGAPAPLKVSFKMLDSDEELAKHQKHRAAFYAGVIIPSLALIGAVLDDSHDEAPVLDKYTLNPVVEFAKAGESVPLLKPSLEAMISVEEFLKETTKGQQPITITLREASYWKHRNSSTDEWIRFADHLKSQGEHVIFVRDTAKANEPIVGHKICPEASIDVDMRMALYEAAKCNLCVSNGPVMLMLHGKRPFLMFVETNSMSPFFPDTPQFWKTWHGINNGEQFPWSLPEQRIVWHNDTFDNIKAAWDDLNLSMQDREAA